MPGFAELILHRDNMSLNRHVEEHLLHRGERVVGAVPTTGGLVSAFALRARAADGLQSAPYRPFRVDEPTSHSKEVQRIGLLNNRVVGSNPFKATGLLGIT